MTGLGPGIKRPSVLPGRKVETLRGATRVRRYRRSLADGPRSGRSVLPAIAGALRRSLLGTRPSRTPFGPEAPGSIRRRPRAGLPPTPALCTEGDGGYSSRSSPGLQLAGSLDGRPPRCQTPRHTLRHPPSSCARPAADAAARISPRFCESRCTGANVPTRSARADHGPTRQRGGTVPGCTVCRDHARRRLLPARARRRGPGARRHPVSPVHGLRPRPWHAAGGPPGHAPLPMVTGLGRSTRRPRVTPRRRRAGVPPRPARRRRR